ncbi:hypothetical protein PSHT_14446 [Puccinia striiformis]|uniref:DUF6589 domain-containing protein n=1 Tax=Puccinia striiformis TaxID=27350 RepID=A0A2S4UK64_9BASI|nr:hypothetical protein PSHT_14446 [Puccinia striiformis]
MEPVVKPWAKAIPKEKKLLEICGLIESYGMTPKSFLDDFLKHKAAKFVVRRRLWGTGTGWKGTQALLRSIKALVCSQDDGPQHWEQFILAQAIMIVRTEEPRRGTYPVGSYVNSSQLTTDFFTNEERMARDQALITQMPFLFTLLHAKLRGDAKTLDDDDPEDDQGVCAAASDDLESNLVSDVANDEEGTDPITGQPCQPKERLNLTETDVNDYEGSFLGKSPDCAVRQALRVRTIARTICAMIAFGVNRRCNGFQLSNSLVFIASGVTERVNTYLNYIGLLSSRRTAHVALKSLGKEAEDMLVDRYDLSKSDVLPPNICYDNLDFQQKVHMKAMGHSSVMSHGTWGYIHSIPPSICKSLNPAELTIEALNKALHAASKEEIGLAPFAPSMESETHFEQMLKSQITRVMLNYVAVASNTCVKLSKDPPPVDLLEPERPNIQMLKLMIASDNSAQGVGEVFTGLIEQVGLTAQEFHSRLQIIEGDLGSCNLLDSLKRQRVPARHNHTSLTNVLPIPGAAHTLWNMAQAIFLSHWGNEKHQRDTGAWRSLHGLGITAEKPVTKKDFNLMLSHMEKDCDGEGAQGLTQGAYQDEICAHCHNSRANLRPCFLRRSVDVSIGVQMCRPQEHALASAGFCNCYRSTAGDESWRLRSTNVHVGAVGCHESGPAKIAALLETSSKTYPPHEDSSTSLVGQSCSVISTYLCPTGRAGHFVATDFYLEVQNYWLKYFFNHSGIGTEINRLKDVFSINIPILRFLLQLLKIESGTNVTHQSHKNKLDHLSIMNFLRMASAEKFGELNDLGYTPTAILDMYHEGIKKLQDEYESGAQGLDRFRPHSEGIYQMYEAREKRARAMDIDKENAEVLSEHSGSVNNDDITT